MPLSSTGTNLKVDTVEIQFAGELISTLPAKNLRKSFGLGSSQKSLISQVSATVDG